MDVIQRSTPYYTASSKKKLPLGLVLHNTVTSGYVEPRPGASWHYEIDRDGKCYQFVNDLDYAYHVRICDEWRPGWMRRRSNMVSEANSCTVGVEIVSWAGSPSAPTGYLPYTDAQYATLRAWLEEMYSRYGDLPIVSHGSLQLDRSDPVGLDYEKAGLTWVSGWGWLYQDSQEFDVEEYVAEQTALREGEILEYLGQLGYHMNPETAIYKRAARAYVLGETRGPAMSDEEPQEDGHVHQRFTAGTADYFNGQVNWVELNK